MDIQRIRNLTTGRLHTEIEHVYQDIEFIVGETGLMTHMLPNACRAIEHYLKAKISDPKFWNGEYDKTHNGEFEILPMNENEKSEFWNRYSKLSSPLIDRNIIVISTKD